MLTQLQLIQMIFSIYYILAFGEAAYAVTSKTKVNKGLNVAAAAKKVTTETADSKVLAVVTAPKAVTTETKILKF